jgi:hypothetical protein
MSGQRHAPSALPPGKVAPVPMGYESGWAPDSNTNRSVVEPVASRYTD